MRPVTAAAVRAGGGYDRAVTMSEEPTPRAEPKLVAKLKERKEVHQERGTLYRAAFVVGGATILLAGLAMLVLPGPAFVVIPVGLAILALEFTWAEELLERSLAEADKAKRKAQETTTKQRILTGIAAACGAGAFVAAAILYDVPVLPVV